jgi:hypothetical protein
LITWRPSRGKEEDVRMNFTDICEQKWEVGNNCLDMGTLKGEWDGSRRGHSLAITQQDITAATVALNMLIASNLVPLIADF